MRPGMIEVTGIPLEALVRAAYNPSRPQGLGHVHFQPGDLSDEDVAAIVERGKTDRLLAVSMDYVKGRSCKFTVAKDGDRLFIKNRWYDHSDSQLRNLLVGVGLSPDLLDKAREDEERARTESLQAAYAFLREHGGSFEETRENSALLPPKVLDGLLEGAYADAPTIKREWTDAGARYTLAAASVPNLETPNKDS